ncbi:hypothetical protein KR767_09115 [Luteibacter anthropi]|uniref:hypothetical protein n=1 Tax=Luteibacter anthropi TaxID=564369 RepID=UPI0020326C9D|nr:hypothetical protein [Luteibacter anthropi]URX64185.1 hypothetical protein KR767_09115 [Luteibacter anthropi]
MKQGRSRRKGACTLLCMTLASGLAAFPALADTAVLTMPPPASGDLLQAWLDARVNGIEAADELGSDGLFVAGMLNDSNSIYSALRPTPAAFRGSAWRSAFNALAVSNTMMSRAVATRVVAWDLGLTKARMGGHLVDGYAPMVGSPRVEANLMKAGVSADIFRQVLHLVGEPSYAVAANVAVALQIIRDKLACVDPSEWSDAGLRKDVVDRVMGAHALAEIDEFDLVYLVRMLEGELSDWAGISASIYGKRSLPAALRVARVAAAYRDMLGYTAATDPCTQEGQHRPGVAAESPVEKTRFLCLVDATDRATYRWFLEVLHAQVDPLVTNFATRPAERVARHVRHIRPLWIGTHSGKTLTEASSIEVVESLVAFRAANPDSEVSSTQKYTDRVSQLLCEKENSP